MNLSESLRTLGSKINTTDWIVNSTAATFLQPVVIPLETQGLDNDAVDITGSPSVSMASDQPCGEALSSQTPAAVKLPGSLDALLYIVIVLMFYAFSIVILMVKYIRREREEANLRNYYHEFVSRDKFRSAQYKNRHLMKRIFGVGSVKESRRSLSSVEEEGGSVPAASTRNTSKQKNQSRTINKNGNTFSRLRVDCDDETNTKESFMFLSAKNQFCKNGFFGKKFCNKQLCSKCVSESAPTIDWDDGKLTDVACSKHSGHSGKETVEVRLHHPDQRSPLIVNSLQKSHQENSSENEFRDYVFERDNSIFFPIMECDSEKENEDAGLSQVPNGTQHSDDVIVHASYDAAIEESAIVSSCSLEVSELLANMPPLGAAKSNSNDMDTLDGLSNLDSEAESQSLLNYSASIRGTGSIGAGRNGESPGIRNKSDSFDERLKDLSDILSERTSLLSCTLSIAAEGEDDDVITNLSSSKHHTTSNSNGKVKDAFKSNGKSLLNSLSKSVSSDEEEMMKLLTDITMLTDESGVFKNLKYFLRSFSRHEEKEEAHEKSNLLPRETYFGPGSPKSFYGDSKTAVVSTTCDPVSHSPACVDLDSVDDDLMNLDECENYGNRWGYTYDEEDEMYSEGDKSSSFGEYCMGEASESQVIDLSKPLVRRQLDPATKDGLSRAFIGLDDPWLEDLPPLNKPNPMIAGYGSARKETKV